MMYSNDTWQIFFKKAILPLFCLLAGCSHPDIPPAVPTFFYWKNALSLADSERAILDSLGVKVLYIKVLDIGRSPETGRIVPLAKTRLPDSTAYGLIPVIFLTNQTFVNISAAEMAELSTHIAQHLRTFSHLPALQLDCDWTASTRAAYFLFLKQMRERLPEGTALSATIRLHQYKLPAQTGVPPVDRGMLMFYNTGDLENVRGNSIFDPRDAQKYVAGAGRYPLPLDMALPIFSWTLVYREGEFWKIIREADLGELRDTAYFQAIFTPKNGELPQFQVKKATFFHGHYLRPTDVLRYESLSADQLREAARLAARVELARDAQVVFFDLDSATLARYPAPLFREINDLVRHR